MVLGARTWGAAIVESNVRRVLDTLCSAKANNFAWLYQLPEKYRLPEVAPEPGPVTRLLSKLLSPIARVVLGSKRQHYKSKKEALKNLDKAYWLLHASNQFQIIYFSRKEGPQTVEIYDLPSHRLIARFEMQVVDGQRVGDVITHQWGVPVLKQLYPQIWDQLQRLVSEKAWMDYLASPDRIE